MRGRIRMCFMGVWIRRIRYRRRGSFLRSIGRSGCLKFLGFSIRTRLRNDERDSITVRPSKWIFVTILNLYVIRLVNYYLRNPIQEQEKRLLKCHPNREIPSDPYQPLNPTTKDFTTFNINFTSRRPTNPSSQSHWLLPFSSRDSQSPQSK